MVLRRERGFADAFIFPSISDCSAVFGVNSRGSFPATVAISPATGRIEIPSNGAATNRRLHAVLGDGCRVFVALRPATRVSGRQYTANCRIRYPMISRVVQDNSVRVRRIRAPSAINLGLFNGFCQVFVVCLFATVVSLKRTCTLPISGVGNQGRFCRLSIFGLQFGVPRKLGLRRVLCGSFTHLATFFKVGLNNVRVVFVRDNAREPSMVNFNDNGFASKRVVAVCRVSGFVANRSFRRIALRTTSNVPSRIKGFFLILPEDGAFRVNVRGTRAVSVPLFKRTTRRLRTRTGTRRQLARFFGRAVRTALLRVGRNDLNLSRPKGSRFVNDFRRLFVEYGRYFRPWTLRNVIREASITYVVFSGYCFRFGILRLIHGGGRLLRGCRGSRRRI